MTHLRAATADPKHVEMQADGRFLVTQNVEVFDVVRSEAELTAVLTSSDDPDARRHVRWRFPDETDAERHERTLTEWARVRTLLTVVERPGEVALIDEHALLARALR